jgi:hypothetical protein
LSAGNVTGNIAPLRWDENTAPDIWGYRLRYTPSGGGTASIVVTNGANSASLLPPYAGTWRIEVAALDAMGQVGPYSPPITVTTLVDPERVWLPLVLKN